MIELKDLNEFWAKIYEQKYLVMRNFENIIEDVNKGEDIDLLVFDKNEFVKHIDAKPLNKNEECYNYYVKIGKIEVPIDIREVGDGYYDEKWQLVMLKNRIGIDGYFTMSNFDYNYSILYHTLLHKDKIPSKYKEFLKRNFSAESSNELEKKLMEFMRENKYSYTKPKDNGVYLNKRRYYKMRLLY